MLKKVLVDPLDGHSNPQIPSLSRFSSQPPLDAQTRSVIRIKMRLFPSQSVKNKVNFSKLFQSYVTIRDSRCPFGSFLNSCVPATPTRSSSPHLLLVLMNSSHTALFYHLISSISRFLLCFRSTIRVSRKRNETQSFYLAATDSVLGLLDGDTSRGI